jgi:membrane-bound serine protease (ClpP class)
MVILGVVMVLAGAGLMAAEAHVPSAGALGLIGLISLVAGGAIAVDASGGGPALVVVVALVLLLIAGAALGTVVRGAASVARKGAKTGAEALVGHVGIVRNALEPVGQVFIDGALWIARPCAFEDSAAFAAGDHVVVEQVKGLTLSVRRAEEWELEI